MGGRGEEVRDGDGETGTGAGKWGEKSTGRGCRERRDQKQEMMGKCKEARGMAGWGELQVWVGGQPGRGVWALALLLALVGVAGLGTQASRSPPSGKSASVPPIPSQAETCAGISSSTQGKCSSCPSKCTQTSPLPSLPGSCQPHASSASSVGD